MKRNEYFGREGTIKNTMMITGHTADSICKAKVSLNLNLPHTACPLC